MKYGDAMTQCNWEGYLIFQPDKLRTEWKQKAERGTCLAKYAAVLKEISAESDRLLKRTH